MPTRELAGILVRPLGDSNSAAAVAAMAWYQRKMKSICRGSSLRPWQRAIPFGCEDEAAAFGHVEWRIFHR
jgi:hypothetical protein